MRVLCALITVPTATGRPTTSSCWDDGEANALAKADVPVGLRSPPRCGSTWGLPIGLQRQSNSTPTGTATLMIVLNDQGGGSTPSE
mmetsp:Transcript_31278/g.85520  ORF Transcript_31278/g.85520 Transcript_31278/m.85520 type:complete len:86 (-) Transcript_31278:1395-1652(-)